MFDDELAEAVPEPDTVPSLRHVFSMEGGAGAKPFAELPLDEGADPAAQESGGTEEDVAVILYTSGTTGKPKGAMLTHLGIIHSAITFARCHGLGPQDRGLVAVPLSHVTGLVGVAFATMVVGGCTVLMRQAFKTPDFLALASRERITSRGRKPTATTSSTASGVPET